MYGFKDRPLVAFDLVGSMAHFRKFYTNSSSLSYHLPPRTTIAGIIAGILGYQRDAYYEEFGLPSARMGVSLRTPVRTVVQTVSLLNTKRDTEDWCGTKSRTLVPTEFVLPKEGNLLRYRVFFQHKSSELTKEFYNRVKNGKSAYPVFLGSAFCLAKVENTKLYKHTEIEWKTVVGRLEVEVDTAIPVECLEDILMQEGMRVFVDQIPLSFDKERLLNSVTRIVWEENAKPLKVVLRKGECFKLPEDKDNVWHIFLEV